MVSKAFVVLAALSALAVQHALAQGGVCAIVPTPTPSPAPVVTPMRPSITTLIAAGDLIVPAWSEPLPAITPTLEEMQMQFTPNNSYLNYQTPSTTGSNSNLGGVVVNTFTLSATSPATAAQNVAGGLYSINYRVQDRCATWHTLPVSIDVRCDAVPTLSSPDQTITIPAGAEVLLTATALDPEASAPITDNLVWTFKSGPNDAMYQTMANVKKILRVPSTSSSKSYTVAFMPYMSGAYTFSVSVTDGCSVTQQDISVTITLDQCDPLDKPVSSVTTAKTVQWWNSGVNTQAVGIGASTAQTLACLPKDYLSAIVGSSSTSDYRSRFSPYVVDSLGARLLNAEEYDAITGLSGGGCTWPAAKNYVSTAEFDNGNCECWENQYMWWMDMDDTSDYYRQFPTTMMPPVLTDNHTLTFYNSRASANSSMETCKRTNWASSTTATVSKDLRIEATKKRYGLTLTVGQLPEPSTSWDATFTYATTSYTTEEWNSHTSAATTWGSDDVDCVITLATAADADGPTKSFTVTAGPTKTFKQCLGRYTYKVQSVPNTDPSTSLVYRNTPPSDVDEVKISVVCPHPPFAQVLCESTVLWNGTSFIRNSMAGDATSGWIQIDARDSRANPGVTTTNYAFNIASRPDMVFYNGAGQTAGQAGQNSLSNPPGLMADSVDKTIGYFKPTYGGTWDVSIGLDDGCNPVQYDNATINAQCLRMTSNPMSLGTTAFQIPSSMSTASKKATTTIMPGASYNGPNGTLSYAFRVLSRPTFMGDSIPGGMYSPIPATAPVGAGTVVGAECMLGDMWDTMTIGRMGQSNFSLWEHTNFTLPVEGTYRFEQIVTDGCDLKRTELPPVTFTCPSAVSFTIDPAELPANTSKWDGTKFPVVSYPTLKQATTTDKLATRFSFFLTKAPPTDATLNPRVYVGGTDGSLAPKLPSKDQVCDAYAAKSDLAPMSAASPTLTNANAPFVIMDNQIGSSKPMLDVNALTYSALGEYQIYVQGDNECSYVPLLYSSLTTMCNDPARLVCLRTGESSDPYSHIPAPASGTCPTSNSVNGVTGGCIKGTADCKASLPWDCVNQRFPMSYISIMADAGEDFTAESKNDVVHAMTTLKAGSANSWLSVEYVKYTATWSIRVRDTASMANPNTNSQGNRGATLDDGGSFGAITSGLAASLPAKFAALTSTSEYTVDSARIMQANVTINDEGTGCFVPYWGRVFQVTATWYVAPPAHFAAPYTGQQTPPATTKPDMRPYNVYNTMVRSLGSSLFEELSTGYPNTNYFTGNNDALPVSAQPSAALNGTLMPTVRFPTTNSVRNWAMDMSAVNPAVRAKTFSSWYMPDMVSTWEVTTSVMDNCPCTGAQCPSLPNTQTNTRTYTASSTAPACQLASTPSVNTTSIKTGAMLGTSPAFQWVSNAKGFGGGFQYAATLPAQVTAGTGPEDFTPVAVTFSTSDVTVQCINAASATPTTTCVTLGSSIAVGSGIPNVGAVARLRSGTPSGGSRRNIIGTNGVTISFTVSAPSVSGALLQVGCISNPGGSTTIDVSNVNFFAGIAGTGAPVAVTYPLPDVCKTASVEIVLYRAPVTAAASFTVSAVTVTEHTAGVMLSPTCGLSAHYISTLSGVSSDFSPSTPTAKGVIDPQTEVEDARGALISAGAVGSLAGSGITPSVSWTVTEPRPSWITQSCVRTSGTTAIQLSCREWLVQTQGDGTVVFQGDKFQYPSAPAKTLVSYTVPDTDRLGLMYRYTITNAPTGSMFNRQWIAENLVDTTTTPDEDKCYIAANALTYAYTRLPSVENWNTAVGITSDYTKTTTTTVDMDSIVVTLKTKALPNSGSQPTEEGKWQLDQYLIDQMSSTCFQPDVQGPYTVNVMVSDGCQNFETNIAITADNCPRPTVTFSAIEAGTVSGNTLTGVNSLSRVSFHAAVEGANILFNTQGQNRVNNATWTVDAWPLSDSTDPKERASNKVTLQNPDSFYPSFYAFTPGTYKVSLWIQTGCLPTAVAHTLTITVGCSPGTVAPKVSVFGGLDYRAATTSAASAMTLTTHQNQGQTFQFIGQPGCATLMNSFFDSTSLTWAATGVYSVAVKGVDPPVLASGYPSGFLQYIVVTLAVGGTTGIPQPLVNPLYHRTSDDDAVDIEVNGVQCTGVSIISYTSGTVGCWVDTLTTGTGVKITAKVLEEESVKWNGDFLVDIVAPTVTRTAPAGTTASIWGGDTVQVYGTNIALTPALVQNFDITKTTITIGGKNCPNVAMGMSGRGADSYLTCTLPIGFGVNLATTVTMAFTNPSSLATSYSTAMSTNSFSYDGPIANTLSMANGDGSGGYMVTASVTNLGPLDLFDSSSLYPGTPGQQSPTPYANLMVTVGGMPATEVSVVTAETSSTPATVQFRMPMGCGDAAKVVVHRGNSMTLDRQTTDRATFKFNEPVITCLGEPYTNPEDSACTTIILDGRNLYMAPGFTVEFLNPSTGDPTDVCDAPSVSHSGDASYRVSCRVGTKATPGDQVRITNSCGQTNTAQEGGLPAMAGTVNVPAFISSISVSDGQSFDTSEVSSAISSASSSTAGGGSGNEAWKDQPMSNGLFIGLALPVLIIVVIAYPLYVYLSRRNSGSVVRQKVYDRSSAPTSSTAGSGSAAGSTRITRNPAARATQSRAAAPPTTTRAAATPITSESSS